MFQNISHPQQRAFLAVFCQKGNVSESATLAGIHRDSHYHWLQTDPDYSEAFRVAHAMAADALEDSARSRAQGTDKEAMRMTQFLLRGLKPERYGTRRIEQTTTNETIHTLDLTRLSDAELKQLEQLAKLARHAAGNTAHRTIEAANYRTIEAAEPGGDRSGDAAPETPAD